MEILKSGCNLGLAFLQKGYVLKLVFGVSFFVF